MPAIQEQVLAALFARLQTLAGSVAGLQLERERDTEVTQFPFVVQRAGDERTETIASGIADHFLEVEIEAYAEGTTALAARQAVSDLQARICNLIAADPGLAGTAVDAAGTGMRGAVEFARGQQPAAAAVFLFEVHYQTREADRYAVP